MISAVVGEVAVVAVDHRDAGAREARDREHRDAGAEREGGVGVSEVGGRRGRGSARSRPWAVLAASACVR